MTEHPKEKDLALYAGNDLPDTEAVLVRRHLAECAGCESLAEEFAAAGEWLASCKSEPLARELRSVRENVMRRMAPRRAGFRWWQWLPVPLACAAAALYWAGGDRTTGRPLEQSADQRVHIALATPKPAAPVPAQARMTRRKRRAETVPGVRAVALITPPGRAAVIRLTTADPNVVILLEADERKDINE